MSAAFIYVFAVLVANLTATLFLPFEVAPGSGILVSVGTLVFGITFTQRDRMHSRGRRFVYTVITLSAFLNLAMLASFRYFWGGWVLEVTRQLEWEWVYQAAAMLRDNGGRVFLASFLAILLAEAADTEVFAYYRGKSWLGRVFRSNLVSVPVDSILFNLMAFAGSPFFPAPVLIRIIFGEIAAKFLVGLAYAICLPRPKPADRPPAS